MRRLDLATVATVTVLAAALSVRTAFAQPPAPQGPPVDRIVSDDTRGPLAYQDWRRRILFEMKVKDHQVLAVLDTGSSTSLIDLGLAKELGLPLTPDPTPVSAAGGNLTVWLAQGAEIAVPGQFKLKASQFRVADLSRISAPPGRNVQFVFGQDFLRSMVLMVRPQQHTFQLAPTGAFKPAPDDDEIALSGSPPTTSVSVGDTALSVTVDTGQGPDLCLTPTKWAKLAPQISSIAPVLSSDITGAVRAERAGTLKELKIGTSTVKNVEVCERDLPGHRNDGLVGYGLLSRFDFAMDHAAGKLWLTPKAQAVTPADR
jgi:hypothetical protein